MLVSSCPLDLRRKGDLLSLGKVLPKRSYSECTYVVGIDNQLNHVAGVCR